MPKYEVTTVVEFWGVVEADTIEEAQQDNPGKKIVQMRLEDGVAHINGKYDGEKFYEPQN